MPTDDQNTAAGDGRAGGQGDCVRLSRSDLRLLRRAARQKWGVPDDYQTEALVVLGKMLTDHDADDRAKLGAVKALIEMTKSDQRDEAEAAKAKEVGGIKEVHERMAAYLDPDEA